MTAQLKTIMYEASTLAPLPGVFYRGKYHLRLYLCNRWLQAELNWSALLKKWADLEAEKTRGADVTGSKKAVVRGGSIDFLFLVYLHLDTKVAISCLYQDCSAADGELFPARPERPLSSAFGLRLLRRKILSPLSLRLDTRDLKGNVCKRTQLDVYLHDGELLGLLLWRIAGNLGDDHENASIHL